MLALTVCLSVCFSLPPFPSLLLALSAKKDDVASRLLADRSHMMSNLTAQRMGIRERKVSMAKPPPTESQEEGWLVVGVGSDVWV
jgi:hypothetical protein